MWTWPVDRPWKRLLSAWLLAALVTILVFRAIETAQLGWTDRDGTERVRASVTRQFAEAQRRLEAAATAVVRERRLVAEAAADPRATRDLFALLQRTASPATGIALSVYTATGAPLAWSGRPSALPRARVGGGSALFVAPGPMGPRLFSVSPIPGPEHDRAGAPSVPAAGRVATLVAELPLPTQHGDDAPPSETVTWRVGQVDVQLRARYEGAGSPAHAGSFTLTGPDGIPLLEGRVDAHDVSRARTAWRARMTATIILLAAVFGALAAAPLMAWRARTRSAARYVSATLAMSAMVLGARALAWVALPGLQSGLGEDGLRGLLFRSPIDFLLTAAAALLLALFAGSSVARARIAWRGARLPVGSSPARMALFLGACVAASAMAVALFRGMLWILRALATSSTTDLLTFSLHHGAPSKLVVETGLVLATAAAVWLAVTMLRAPLILFRLQAVRPQRLAAVAAWVLPPLTTLLTGLAGPAAVAIAVAASWRRIARGYRHASQATRLIMLFSALVVPVVSWYPALFVESDAARRVLIAQRLAPQAISQRFDLQARVRFALTEIDAINGLDELVQSPVAGTALPVPTESAFHVWSQTDLSRARLTSAIELYGPNRLLVSRFALKLPDYTSAQQVWEGEGCDWKLFEEVSPFFSEERRLLYAGRGLCVPTPGGPRLVGAIAIYAMLDHGDLPFIAAQNPYVAVVRGQRAFDPETVQSRNLDFVVYGWSRRPVYASGAAWTLDDETFRRVYASRDPFWTTLSSAGQRYAVHITNDRGGIYALGYPTLSGVEHLVNVAELVVLGGLTFIALLSFSWLTALAGGYRDLSGRELLREVRASFYRKLFLAFVASAAIPVITLAFVAQAYLASRLLAGIEEAAARTASVAQRVVEDYAQMPDQGERRVDTVDDDILVWIARVIDQDVNVFEGPTLMATSERSLYASGVLPTRTSADIYRAIVLDRQAAHVARDRVGAFDYLSASAPVRLGDREAILTVPLTLRQQAIEQEITDLTRRILLAVLAFILAGSGLGYWMAERIADPVNRLQRATARIARGDLTVRVALTSSDELRRLVEAFNQMAGELQRQQGELARVYKLEAWADMARQVAHEIKNPLTPNQLSAEHLRRVHADRGAPLSPVLDSCVDSILTQVRLLRQIAGEFSSFASSPTARPVETSVEELLFEVMEPYRPGLEGRVDLRVELPGALPAVRVDRTLIGRALTNVIDNALHAMPNGGSVTVTAERT
ncbi:MAG: HAMP domain-containing protein, partial [Vicinamibacterales bacterium]|nr:HAMP domain-containing protein [Vicinamibacterales bacterium]